jgi:MFS family permease
MNRFFSDRVLIYICSFLRSISFGMIAVILAIFLMQMHFTKAQIGFIISVGLIGAALGNIVATFLGNRIGRRKTLILYGLLTAASGIAIAFSENFYTILCISFLGMLNARGKDRGAAVVLESTMLPSVESSHNRTKAFAWYAIVQDVGLALGGVLAGLPTLLQAAFEIPLFVSLQSLLYFYAGSMVVMAFCYSRLSAEVELSQKEEKASCSPKGKKIIFKISSLFALDSLGSGFLTSALVAYYLYERFDVGVEVLGLLFFFARILNALSYFIAVWLSKRIGLLKTMFYSHAPSHFLLIAIALTPSFPVVVALFLLRECLVEMDVPTRQSYVMAVVDPSERTFAAGATQVVRMAGWAFGPALAGLVMHHIDSVAPLYIGAGMKLCYDLLLYFSFKKIKPPEEAAELKVEKLSA